MIFKFLVSTILLQWFIVILFRHKLCRLLIAHCLRLRHKVIIKETIVLKSFYVPNTAETRRPSEVKWRQWRVVGKGSVDVQEQCFQRDTDTEIGLFFRKRHSRRCSGMSPSQCQKQHVPRRAAWNGGNRKEIGSSLENWFLWQDGGWNGR